MISRIVMCGFAAMSLSACVNDGQIFEDGGEGIIESFPGNPSTVVDPDDFPVVIMDEGVIDGGVSESLPPESSGDGVADGGTETDVEDPTVVIDSGPTDADVDASNSLFLLPADCELTVGDDGRKYCFSQLPQATLYVTTANDRLLWTHAFDTESGFEPDRFLVDDSIMVLSRAADDSGMWNLISFSRQGEILFDTSALAGTVEVADVQLRDNALFVVSNRGEGNGFQLSRIDRTTGEVTGDLRFPESTVGLLEFDSAEGVDRVILSVDGFRQFYDANTFERLVIIYALDPSNYQLNTPSLINNFRAGYTDNFVALLGKTTDYLNSGVAPLETDGTVYSCELSGTVELLPQTNTVNAMTLTRAYRYTDCMMSDGMVEGMFLNGDLIYSMIGVQTASGTNGTEILTLTSVGMSTSAAGAAESDSSEMPAADARTLTASISNSWVDTEQEFSSDLVINIDSYTETSEAGDILVGDSSYSRSVSGASGDAAAGVFRLIESGQSSVTAPFTGNRATTLSMDPAFSYGDPGSTLSPETLASSPLSGSLLIEADDGSSLQIDAFNDSGASRIVYSLNSEAGSDEFTDAWLAEPLKVELRLMP